MPARRPFFTSGMNGMRGMNMETLHDIGLRHNTDKATYHGYTAIYAELLDPLRKTKATILELGWGGYGGITGPGGESARMWVEAFPKGRVVVLDDNPGRSEVPDRCELVIGDQADKQLLTGLAERYGGFDVIIDDASHIGRLTRQSWEILWPHLLPGGWYFIEDLNTSYLSRFEGEPNPDAGVDTSITLVKHLVDVAQTEGIFAREQTGLLGYIDPIGLARIVLTGNIVALQKAK